MDEASLGKEIIEDLLEYERDTLPKDKLSKAKPGLPEITPPQPRKELEFKEPTADTQSSE